MDIDKIILTKDEKKLLKKISKMKKYKYDNKDKVLVNLQKYNLIEPIYTDKVVYGRKIVSSYVQPSANYERYKKQQLSNFIERKIPIILSIIAIIISIFALLKP